MRTYSEMLSYSNFWDRYQYLVLHQAIMRPTFGGERYLNQRLYQSPEWKRFRRQIVLRDNDCELGIDGMAIPDHEIRIVHHINPLTIEQLLDLDDCVFDPENVVLCSRSLHNAIHYGDKQIDLVTPNERRPGDTCPWL